MKRIISFTPLPLFLIPLPLFLVALPLGAATTVQQVTEVSAQQAIVRYRTTLSPSTACSWAVTETVSGAVPGDVNPSIFANSNLDTRPGSIINGPDREFVLGQRTSAVGSDGLLHSRSLKANTAYTAVVTCTGDAPVTASFSTGNIQLGGTVTEQPPYNSGGFGGYAWPMINWADQTKEYPDPMTGIVMKRVTFPGMWGQERPPANFDFAVGGAGWTNPQNILPGTTCAGTSTNCAETTNSNPIFLSIKGQLFSNGDGCEWSSGFSSCDTYDDFLVTLTGKATVAQNLTVCLSYFDSGATCQSANQSVHLATSVGTTGFPAAGVGYVSGANVWAAQFQFGEWGGTAPKRGDFGMAYGLAASGSGVTTSGTAVTGHCTANNTSAFACFDVRWNNSYFYIQGSGCTDGGTDICQVNGHPTDTQHLTLKNAPATACASQCNFDSLAAGVRITPSGTGTVDIGAQYSYAYSAMFGLAGEGDAQMCNPTPVSVGFEADGTTTISPPLPGQLCMFQFQSAAGAGETLADAELMLMIPSRGEMRLLSPLYTPAVGVNGNATGADTGDAAGDQNAAQIVFPLAPWDGTCGTCIYGWAPTATSGKYAIYKGVYDTTKNWKSYSHALWAPATSFCCAPGMDATSGYGTQARWADDPILYTNITKPSATCGSSACDLGAQIAAHNTTWNSSIWPLSGLGFDRVASGQAVFKIFSGGQNTPASLNFFNLSSGLLTAWGDTMFAYPLQFCGFHASFVSLGQGGLYGIACDQLEKQSPAYTFGGPYQATPYWLCTGTGTGSCTTNTAITASVPSEDCNAYTISAPLMALINAANLAHHCMHFRTKNLTSRTPSAAELSLYPSGQNAAWSEPTVLAAGAEVYLPNTGAAGENDFVVAVTTGVTDSLCSSDCLDVVAVRGMPAGNGPSAEANGWTIGAGPALGACGQTLGINCMSGVGVIVSAAATGSINSTGTLAPLAFQGHVDMGAGNVSSNMTYVQSGGSTPYSTCPNASTLTCAQNLALPADTSKVIGSTPAFYGIGAGNTCAIQSYPSNEQYNASTQHEKSWALDHHHYNPSSGILGTEQFTEICSASYSLVGGFTSVYLATPAGGLSPSEANYKTHGLIAWAGPHLLVDVSGPGSALADGSPYQICEVFVANECVTGSSVNQVYVTVPYVPSLQSYCVVDWFTENYPCVLAGGPTVGAWLVQHDASQSYSLFEYARKLTMAFTGPGRQYEYSTFIPETTGTWGLVKSDWLDGIRSEIMMAKLPPFPAGGSVPRNTFVTYPVQVPAGPAYAEIRFGYLENGSAQAYYCTSRQDACTTSGSPFRYSSIDSRTLTSCSSGCTINIPVIAGRTVYYSIGSSANGSAWTYGAPQVGLVQ